MALSKFARDNKTKYNMERNKELTKLLCARLPKEEYKEICEYLQQIKMNKAEFVRWAYNKLREEN